MYVCLYNERRGFGAEAPKPRRRLGLPATPPRERPSKQSAACAPLQSRGALRRDTIRHDERHEVMMHFTYIYIYTIRHMYM